MAEIIPFMGILYNTFMVSSDDVVAPPYDIVSPEQRKALYEKSEYNIIRIDFGQEYSGDDNSKNKYSRASDYLNAWLEKGILIKSEKPCFYAYEMAYETGGTHKALRGFFGLVKLVELSNGIYPHEATHSKPKKDRLSLMTACEANTSSIFSIYKSNEKKASEVIERTIETKPYMEARDMDGNFHRLWVIENKADINAISEDMSSRDIIIADGHHRYETALEYQKVMKGKNATAKGCDYVLMFLANTADEGLTILPTHRVITYTVEKPIDALAEYFDVKAIPQSDDIMNHLRGQTDTFGLYLKEGDCQYILRYRGDDLREMHPVLKKLDVTVLHDLIFREILKVSNICYEMDPATARTKVLDCCYNAVFFLNPTKVEDVEAVAFSCMRMPPKSTYFYPKVMTGFVMNSLKNSVQEG